MNVSRSVALLTLQSFRRTRSMSTIENTGKFGSFVAHTATKPKQVPESKFSLEVIKQLLEFENTMTNTFLVLETCAAGGSIMAVKIIDC